jgi:hypothetical protein
MSVTERCGRYGLFSISFFSAFSCVMSVSTLIFAQDAAKPATERWRPKDGIYGYDDGRAFTVPCENFPLHYVELSKGSIAANEMYVCKFTTITDAAPGVLRLNASCDTNSGKFKSVITLRKIDEKSFVMSSPGKQSRFVYCHENDERGDSK